MAYGEFDETAKAELRAYIDAMSDITPTLLNRDEQLAYWINLYNAQTIQVVSIIQGKRAFYPWVHFFTGAVGRTVFND